MNEKPLTGNRDADLVILSKLDDKDLFNFCIDTKNKYVKYICNNNDFWRNRLISKYPEFKINVTNWKKLYLQSVYYLEKYTLNKALQEATKGGMKNFDLIQLIISQGANYWNVGMYEASLKGHKDLVDFFISKGANDWNWGMKGAAE